MDTFDDKEYFTYDELKEQLDFLKSSTFGKIYEELNNNDTFDNTGKGYCSALKSDLGQFSHDDNLLYNFCNNLYKIIVKNWNSDVFAEIKRNDEMYCFSLKYWLYDNLKSLGPKNIKIDKIFEEWQMGIKNKVDTRLEDPCIFTVLEWKEYNTLKSIYAFILLYYMNVKSIYEKGNVDCKYLKFFGEGLKAYYESLNKCSTEKEDDNYCKEFNEFQKIYGLRNIYWETSTGYEKYSSVENSSEHCALKIESHNAPLRISYWYENEKLHLSDYPIDFKKSTIISASSALGATAGISAFLLYLFKFTNIRSLFGRGKQQDNTMFLNVDEESHDFTFPISYSKYTNFGNNQYNI
ncbi:PIR Superfamily Protein [Plasmodium ovale wallikeri]|uniref:PIR Superfamily Protein n=1 Tax=Plasmodium ovale wallikeri TaxID=864142 RepID=A0A1A9AR22_PLAOA|nr:PIR Superfamily Protein [Plasmodium ovale wallikeri]SBT58686.1 PIR Superfamily Protein [Plasmodium ovale wallikeri]